MCVCVYLFLFFYHYKDQRSSVLDLHSEDILFVLSLPPKNYVCILLQEQIHIHHESKTVMILDFVKLSFILKSLPSFALLPVCLVFPPVVDCLDYFHLLSVLPVVLRLPVPANLSSVYIYQFSFLLDRLLPYPVFLV